MKLLLLFPLLLSPLLAARQPNIVLMFADDLGRYASAYADQAHPSVNDVIRTPVFDRVAREGARFDHAFVSSPSCTPSRGSLYTGRHFFRNGSASQLHSRWQTGHKDPFDDIVGMPETLARAGYHIGWSHKMHLPARLFRGTSHHYAASGGLINTYSHAVTASPDARRKIFEAVKSNFRSFLKDRKDGQPFFYSFNPTNTHRQWERGSGKALWGLDPGSLEGKLPPFLPDNEVIREDFADYLGEAMAFDAACGVILEELESSGELDNTLVCISGDHGAPGFPLGKCNVGDFGSRVLLAMRWPDGIAPARVVKQPVSLIDLAPTFLAAAGLTSPDDPDGENLLPALKPSSTDQKLRGWALIGREVHFNAARDGYLPYPVRALRTDRFLYVRNFKPDRWPAGNPPDDWAGLPDFDTLAKKTGIAFGDIDSSPTKAWCMLHRDQWNNDFQAMAWGKRPAEELYDLANDPHQVRNLAPDPTRETTLRDLREKLLEILQKAKDPRLNDGFDHPPYLVNGTRWKGP